MKMMFHIRYIGRKELQFFPRQNFVDESFVSTHTATLYIMQQCIILLCKYLLICAHYCNGKPKCQFPPRIITCTENAYQSSRPLNPRCSTTVRSPPRSITPVFHPSPPPRSSTPVHRLSPPGPPPQYSSPIPHFTTNTQSIASTALWYRTSDFGNVHHLGTVCRLVQLVRLRTRMGITIYQIN